MVLSFYVIICVLSLVCCVLFFWNRRSYYPVLYALVYLLALVSHVCYVLLAVSKDVREALIINKGIYVGGCFFPLVGLMIVFSICQIKIPRFVNFILILLASAVYCLSFTAGYSPIFYKNVEIEQRYGITVLIADDLLDGISGGIETSPKEILRSLHSCRSSPYFVTSSDAWS